MTSPSGDHVLECLRRLAIAERVPEPSPQLLKRSMRILGSSIAASRPDIHTTLATIKGRLVRQSGEYLQRSLTIVANDLPCFPPRFNC